MVLEFKKTEQYIQELLALKSYERVIKENEILKRQLAELAESNKELEKNKQDYEELKRKYDEAVKSMQSTEEKAYSLLDQIVSELSNPKPHSFPPKVEEAGLQQKVNEIIEREVAKRLGVRTSGDAISKFRDAMKQEINDLIRLWPSELGLRTEEKIQLLRNEIDSNPFTILQNRKWKIHCSKCKFHFVELDVPKIESLLARRHLTEERYSTNDEFPVSHQVFFSLSYLIHRYLIWRLTGKL